MSYKFQIKQARKDGKTNLITIQVNRLGYADALRAADLIEDEVNGAQADAESMQAWRDTDLVFSEIID